MSKHLLKYFNNYLKKKKIKDFDASVGFEWF